MVTIEIPGPPVPWTARVVTRSGHSYSPKIVEKSRCRILVRQQYKSKPLEGAIFLEIYFHMPIRASLSKKKATALIGTPHMFKPDCTNLQKFIEDCLTGIVFKDDQQVWKILSYKKYSENPKTVIHIHGGTDGIHSDNSNSDDLSGTILLSETPSERSTNSVRGKMKKAAGMPKVKKVMSEFKHGTLHSGSKHGPLVENPAQAKAIALSEARKAGAKIPVKKAKK